MTFALDHITVTAYCLQAGIAHVEAALGVSMQMGAEHPRMGTHNAFIYLGPGVFLEVIAINPNAPRPAFPRWFELDTLTADSRPKLATWVVRTDEINRCAAQCAYSVGEVQTIQRGLLSWDITLPSDGSLAMQGCLPALIEWHVDDLKTQHPSAKLIDTGCRLEALLVMHPEPAIVKPHLDAFGLQETIALHTATAPQLLAHIVTPAGRRSLV